MVNEKKRYKKCPCFQLIIGNNCRKVNNSLIFQVNIKVLIRKEYNVFK